jgi:hypothetical protein
VKFLPKWPFGERGAARAGKSGRSSRDARAASEKFGPSVR